jgi:hypothetical protein
MLGNMLPSGSSPLQKFSPLLFDLQNHFLQVRTLAEAVQADPETLKEICLISKHALIALDYALFAAEAAQAELPLTSVSAAAAANDVAESLRQLANAYDVELKTDITKKLEPVYANEAALKGSLYGLASSIITTIKTDGKRPRVIIAAQETMPNTQRLGVYSPDVVLPWTAIKAARSLAGKARFVAPKEMHHAGLGLVVSDQLAQALGSCLKSFSHRGHKGIGFYVPMSNQLNFV